MEFLVMMRAGLNRSLRRVIGLSRLFHHQAQLRNLKPQEVLKKAGRSFEMLSKAH
jgi:hypothetical protein